jgi:hypothetical protein
LESWVYAALAVAYSTLPVCLSQACNRFVETIQNRNGEFSGYSNDLAYEWIALKPPV